MVTFDQRNININGELEKRWNNYEEVVVMEAYATSWATQSSLNEMLYFWKSPNTLDMSEAMLVCLGIPSTPELKNVSFSYFIFQNLKGSNF